MAKHKQQKQLQIKTQQGFPFGALPAAGMPVSIKAAVLGSLKISFAWLFSAMFVFFAGSAVIFYFAASVIDWAVLKAFLFIGIFGAFGSLALSYGLAMAILFSARYFSGAVTEAAVFNINSLLGGAMASLENYDAVAVIKQGFNTLYAQMRKYTKSFIGGLVVFIVLGGVMFLSRKSLIKKAAFIKNKADLLKFISDKGALVSGVLVAIDLFLMRFAWIGYLAGFATVCAQIAIIFLFSFKTGLVCLFVLPALYIAAVVFCGGVSPDYNIKEKAV